VLRERGLPGLPRTEHEARIMLREVRKAIGWALKEHALIPGQPAPADDDDAGGT
jgi:hypothetical protein